MKIGLTSQVEGNTRKEEERAASVQDRAQVRQTEDVGRQRQ